MSRLHFLDLPSDHMEADVVCVLFFEDERPLCGPAALPDWRLNGALTKMILSGEVSGRAGESVLIRNNGKMKADWVFFMGGGSLAGLGIETYQGLVEHLIERCRLAGFERVALPLFPIEELQGEQIRKMVSGILARFGSRAPECLLSFVE